MDRLERQYARSSHDNEKALHDFLLAPAPAEAEQILMAAPLLLHDSSLQRAREIVRAGIWDSNIEKLLEHRLSILQVARSIGIAKAFDAILLEGPESADYDVQVWAARALGQFAGAVSFMETKEWLENHPELICRSAIGSFGDANTTLGKFVDVNDRWDIMGLLKQYIIARAFEKGVDRSLREGLLLNAWIQNKFESLTKSELARMLAFLPHASDFTDADLKYSDRIKILCEHSELLEDSDVPVVESFMATNLDTHGPRTYQHELQSLWATVRREGLEQGIVTALLNEIVWTPDDERARQLSTEFAEYFDSDGEGPDIAIGIELDSDAQTQAEGRLRLLRLARTQRREGTEALLRQLGTCATWPELRYLLYNTAIPYSYAAAISEEMNIEAVLPLNMPELLRDVRDTGVEGAVERARRRASQQSRESHSGRPVISLDNDWMIDHGLRLEAEQANKSYSVIIQRFIRILLTEHAVAPRLGLLEDALTLSDADFDGLQPYTPEWGMAMSLRSSILEQRYVLQGDLSDLDEQIRCITEASRCQLDVNSMVDVEARRVDALAARFSVWRDIRDLSKAIEIAETCYQKYGEVDQVEAVEFANLWLAQARACHSVFTATGDGEQLKKCQRLLRQGLRTPGLPKVIEADFLNGLGIALSAEAYARKSGDTANEAFECYTKSLSSQQPGQAGYVNVILNIASLLSEAVMPASANDRFAEWRPKVLDILEAGELRVEEELRACYFLADSYGSEEDWVNAAKYSFRWARVYHAVTRRQISERFREAIIRKFSSRLAETAIYQMLADQVWEAVATLEQSRMSLITDRFNLIPAVDRVGSAEEARAVADIALYERIVNAEEIASSTLDSPPRSLRVLKEARQRRDAAYNVLANTEPSPETIYHSVVSPDSIRSAAASAPLIYITPGRRGGMAIVVQSGRDPEAIRLPLLLTEKVLEITRDIYGSGRRRLGLAAAIETASAHLWDMCIERLIDVVVPGRYFVVPCGLLGLLPLHAAWTRDENRPSGKVYTTDFYEISYCLSGTARFLSRLQTDTAESDGGRFPAAIVDNPADFDASSLNISGLETAAMLRYFPDSLVLSGDDATVANVLNALKSTSWTHFSCHGEADPLNPRESFLRLANGERLRVRDLMNLDLSSQRGIVLSACESGRFGEDLPDESIGLPGALVAVGVPQVIGSMWRIPQISAAELIVRICRSRAEGKDLAAALHEAQIDTRDSTAAQKRLFFADEGLEYPGLAPQDELPCARVYDWAAFSLYTVPGTRV